MCSLEHFDLLIGDALERLVKASSELKKNGEIDNKLFLMKIGRAVTELWSLREELYKINPNLKRDFVIEHENDKERFENLNKLHITAFEKEKSGNVSSARKYYQELYTVSSFGYFRLLAEAGLYRTSKKEQ